jgi:peptidoglycan/xylan/chitin deacetylase (PgdA/CDA1 family)
MFWNQSSQELQTRLLASLSDWKNRCSALSAVPFHRFYGRHPSTGVAVITYHRVMPRLRGRAAAPLSVTPKKFASQIAGLLSTGYQPIGIGDMIRRHADGLLPTSPTFAVAFDDGFECVHRFALPILKDLRVPATVFVPTGHLDSVARMPFDPWRHAGDVNVPGWSWRSLSRGQCTEMLDSGLIELGSHTHMHESFGDDLAAFRIDMEMSRDYLAREFAVHHPSFSFPFGQNCPEMRAIVRGIGMSAAFTTQCGNVHRDDNAYSLNRLGAEEWDTTATLAAKIDGWFEHLRSRWQGLRRRFPANNQAAPSATHS